MGKGLRSKIMRRWRTLKRGHIKNVVEKETKQRISETLEAVAVGR